MFDSIAATVGTGLRFLAERLKTEVDDYCDLETTAEGHLVAKDASMGTMFRYEGFRTLISHKEFLEFCEELANGLDTYMGQRGHQIQFVFHRDDDADDEIMRYLGPSYDTCEAVGMDMSDILDEKRRVMSDYCMDEQVHIVLWTRPSVLNPTELKMNQEETRELMAAYKLPPMAEAQDFLRPNRFLVDRHEAFIGHFNQLVLNLRGWITQMDAREYLRTGKRFLYRNSTPRDWMACLLGDPMFVRWKEKNDKDLSVLSYPRIASQIFTAPAQNGGGAGDGALTDIRSVRFGDRLFAPVFMKIPPMRNMSFGALFNALNNAAANTSRGTKPLPWAISFMLTGDGLKGTAMRTFMAGILSIGSEGNRNLGKAFKALAEYKNDGGTIVQMKVTACTWAPLGNEKELILRRSKLTTALQNWGNASVEEETGDAAEAIVTSCPGMTTYAIAPASAPPLKSAVTMLPLARPASPFFRGQTLYRTLDGKLMPWESFSADQNTWVTLWFGGPGSGKSVQANRSNLDMCLMGGNKKLPWLGILDMGISSLGVIQLLQDSLPSSMRHLSMYVRLQNTEEYCVNVPGDTQLGCRYPLPPEMEFKVNFLTLLATPAARAGKPHMFMSRFVSRVILESYRRCSDLEERGQPKPYTPSQCEAVAEAVERLGIQTTEATKWWEVVDALYEKGEYYLASVAQRYAVPILVDFLNTANDQEIRKDFVTAMDETGMAVTNEFDIMIGSALDQYKMFSGPTRFDTGESRVMAIDLQDVVARGASLEAKQNGAIMYGAALYLFTSKINIHQEMLESVNKRYRPYHARRVEELAEEYKRLFIDEYHNTGNNENLREGILVFGRESRKWGLELTLASQLPQDFRELAEIATTAVIMDAGNEKTRRTIQEIFGLSDAEVAALKKFVHGPQPGIGGTFLAKIKTKTSALSQLFTSTLGGKELWALSTTQEDRALRTRLYNELSPVVARRVLAERFPGGCKSYVMQRKTEAKDNMGNEYVDEDAEDSIIKVLAKELIADWQRKQSLAAGA